MRGGALLRRVALGSVALAVSVAGAELLLRWTDPFGALRQGRDGSLYQREIVRVDLSSPRLFRHGRNLSVPMSRYVFRTNDLGLRGPDVARPKPAGTRRILFLGDSVVLGWGVAEEDTFVRRVEGELRASCPAVRWETINAGHLLHDTTQEAAVLEEVGEDCAPDLVALVFVDNDIVLTRLVQQSASSPPPDEEVRRFLGRMQLVDRLAPLLPGIHAALSHGMVRTNALARQGSAAHAEALGFSLEDGWVEASRALLEIRDWCAVHGAEFLLLDYAREGRLTDELKGLAAAEGIRYGTIGFTAADRVRDIRNSAADAHANPLGHRILTGYVLEHLRRTETVREACGPTSGLTAR